MFLHCSKDELICSSNEAFRTEMSIAVENLPLPRRGL
jgi:hypothetical protein